MVNKYHKIIKPKNNAFELKLKELFNYKDLILLFTKKYFITFYKQTILGPIWLILNPIISSIIFSVIFGGIAKIKTGNAPQFVFYLVGNIVWSFFANCINKNSRVFLDNASIFGKVYFPRLTVPVSNILLSAIELGIQLVLVMVVIVICSILGYTNPVFITWLIIPLLIVIIGVIGMNVGIIISSFTTKYRDLMLGFHFIVQVWMYATPVVYPLSQVKNELLRNILLINPMTSLMELFKLLLIGEGTISTIGLLWSVIFMVITLLFGISTFNKVEKTFMDTI